LRDELPAFITSTFMRKPHSYTVFILHQYL
jgi:hypothetical protein